MLKNLKIKLLLKLSYKVYDFCWKKSDYWLTQYIYAPASDTQDTAFKQYDAWFNLCKEWLDIINKCEEMLNGH